MLDNSLSFADDILKRLEEDGTPADTSTVPTSTLVGRLKNETWMVLKYKSPMPSGY